MLAPYQQYTGQNKHAKGELLLDNTLFQCTKGTDCGKAGQINFLQLFTTTWERRHPACVVPCGLKETRENMDISPCFKMNLSPRILTGVAAHVAPEVVQDDDQAGATVTRLIGLGG